MRIDETHTCLRYGSGPNDFKLVPRRAIETRDAASIRTHGERMPLMRPGDSIHTATARERGWTRDDVLEGNAPRKSIALGTVYTATGEEIRDYFTDPVRPLQPGKNFVLGEVVEAEDVEEYTERSGRPPISLGTTYTALSKDHEMNENGEVTQDARSRPVIANRRSFLAGTAKGISAADYQQRLREGRAAKASAAPASVVTSADYAANLAAGRAAAKARG